MVLGSHVHGARKVQSRSARIRISDLQLCPLPVWEQTVTCSSAPGDPRLQHSVREKKSSTFDARMPAVAWANLSWVFTRTLLSVSLSAWGTRGTGTSRPSFSVGSMLGRHQGFRLPRVSSGARVHMKLLSSGVLTSGDGQKYLAGTRRLFHSLKAHAIPLQFRSAACCLGNSSGKASRRGSRSSICSASRIQSSLFTSRSGGSFSPGGSIWFHRYVPQMSFGCSASSPW